MGRCDMVGFGTADNVLLDSVRSLYGDVEIAKTGIIPFVSEEAIRRERDHTDEAVQVFLWSSGTTARLLRETAERNGTTAAEVLAAFVEQYEAEQ